MYALEKAELTTSMRHIVRFLKLGIPIYYPEVPDMAGRKVRKKKEERRQLQSVLSFTQTQ